MTKLKVGLDIHGVIDHDPQRFIALSQTEGIEVYIITGIKQELEENFPADLKFISWHSIHAECEARGYDVRYDEKGRPWVDENLWDPIKADFCKELGIDIMIDDSPVYGKYFDDISTSYLEYRNMDRTSWRDDGTRTDDGSWHFTIKKPVIPEPLQEVIDTGKVFGRALGKLGKFAWQGVKKLYAKTEDARLWVSAMILTPMTNYQYDSNVNDFVKEVIESDEWVSVNPVDEGYNPDSYYLYFKNMRTRQIINVWSSNRFYAFASDAYNTNGSGAVWRSARASRYNNYRLYLKAVKAGNI